MTKKKIDDGKIKNDTGTTNDISSDNVINDTDSKQIIPTNTDDNENKTDIEIVPEEKNNSENNKGTDISSESDNGTGRIDEIEPNEGKISETPEEKIEPEIITEKKKRGRPKKGEEKTKKDDEINYNSSLDELKKKIADTPNYVNPALNVLPLPETKQDVALITGFILLTGIDTVFPPLISYFLSKYKDRKIAVNDLYLTDKERKELEPLADAVAKQYLTKISPMIAFIFALGGVYGGKVMSKL